MDHPFSPLNPSPWSPYRMFSRDQWAALRGNTPSSLTHEEIEELTGVNEFLDLQEVETIYLPLARLLALQIRSSRFLSSATQEFLGGTHHNVPYVLGIAGSVAVGKSTTARILQSVLSRSFGFSVDLIATDGFLFPNRVLEERGILDRKGFPKSYDRGAILSFLQDLKGGKEEVKAPVYSHLRYDIVEDQHVVLRRPDVVIVEGLNVLQAPLKRDPITVHVSDFFDFSIYLDAECALLEHWYIERFLTLRRTMFLDPTSYFQKYAHLSQDEALQVARALWRDINLKNLKQNILPTRGRAKLILRKEADHAVHGVWLRKV